MKIWDIHIFYLCGILTRNVVNPGCHNHHPINQPMTGGSSRGISNKHLARIVYGMGFPTLDEHPSFSQFSLRLHLFPDLLCQICQFPQLIECSKEAILSMFAHHVRPQPARSHAALRTLPVPGPDQQMDGGGIFGHVWLLLSPHWPLVEVRQWDLMGLTSPISPFCIKLPSNSFRFFTGWWFQTF